MWQCRKIYANLLLLSVLLFSLGAAVRPAYSTLFAGGTATWSAPAENVEFRWEAHGAAVVYRSQQITAVTAGDWDLIVPEGWCDLRLTGPEEKSFVECWRQNNGASVLLPVGRAPPAKGDC